MPAPRRRKLKVVCKYRNFIEAGDTFLLPMVPIRLSKGDIAFRTVALIDSGATCSFITKDDAEILDLPLTEESSATGAGGSFRTFVSEVNIDIFKGVRSIFTFSDLEVQIPQDKGDIPSVILGRDSIFSAFEIIFREKDKKFVMKSY